jgi:site-specific DNA-methyltransferase (adenine-specific)
MLELNKVYNEDCLIGMKNIEDKSVDMILCDLPYGTTACKWDTIIPFEPLWEQYKRIIKDNGAIVLTASQPFTSALVMSNIKMFKYCWSWNKNSTSGFVNAKNKPMNTMEDIAVFSKGTCANKSDKKMKYFPQGLIQFGKETKRGNKQSKENTYWRPSTKSNMNFQEFTNYPRNYLEFQYQSKSVHPTQKPVALFEYLIKTYTNEGDLVLDNCAGSFTTAIACENTKRNWICIEKDEKYCEIGLKRINENKNKKAEIQSLF